MDLQTFKHQARINWLQHRLAKEKELRRQKRDLSVRLCPHCGAIKEKTGDCDVCLARLPRSS